MHANRDEFTRRRYGARGPRERRAVLPPWLQARHPAAHPLDARLAVVEADLAAMLAGARS